MEILRDNGWVYYVRDREFDSNKVGKWMYFFSDKKFVAEICEYVVKNNIVKSSKHSDKETGVACFYLNCDDIETHKRIISYLMENNLIRKTKEERLFNISFKFDKQTLAGEYGDEFHPQITLSTFVDLDTGKWLV